MPRNPGIPLETTGLPRAQRRRLERLAAKARSVEDLRHKARPEDRDALERAIRGAFGLVQSRAAPPPAPSDPNEGPFPGLSRPELARAWIEARCPPYALDSDLWEVIGSSLCMQHRIYGEITLEDLLYTPRWHTNAVERAVSRWVTTEASVHQDAVEMHQLAERWRSVPPDEPLRAGWSVLRQAQATLLDSFGGPLPLEPMHRVDVHEDGPSLSVPMLARLTLQPEPRLHLYDDDPDALAAVNAMLDVLTSPRFTEGRAALVDLLSQSYSARVLGRLTRKSARVPLPADEDKRELGWEWLTPEWSLCPVQCRPAKRGGSFVTRRIDRADPRSELFADPAEARVLTLGGHRDGPVHLTSLRLLAGHPRVFASAHRRKRALRVREARLTLGVRRQEQGVRVRLELDGEPVPELEHDTLREGLLVLVTPTELVFAEVPDPLHTWLRGLGSSELILQSEEELAALRQSLGPLSRSVPLDVDPHVLGQPLVGDPRPRMVCRWQDGALDLVAQVAPAPDAAAHPPGKGPAVLLVERGGEVRSLHRDLDHEPARVRQHLDALEHLELPPSAEVSPFRWGIHDVQHALAVLDGLRAHREDLQLAWSGDPPVPPTAVSGRDVQVRIGSGTDWFGLSGSVSAGRERVDLDSVLEAASRGDSYVSIGDNRWARIESGLREQLEALGTVREEGSLGVVQGALVDELSELGATIEASTAWRDRRAAATASTTLQVEVPDELQAELRPYQQEGFRWLARLATWAPGACLADDMGLGKTLQSLALLLHRSHEGPALVVCPTSVVDNWAAEAARFTPTLAVAAYRGSDRQGLLDEQARPDVLITSYGILTRDAEALAQVPWATLVLDEAQAIRNPTAQRTRAALSVPAGFKLALSGTPIQNRTSELWSVMTFAVPGLLGSRSRFHETFAVPIEGHQDQDRRDLLARLISPFVLRRTKHLVARELPDKTEQIIQVSLSDDEAALYAAERRAAVERLRQAGSKRGFRMLQELTRLRQLACHPKLVDASTSVRSSKLRQVLSTLNQLRAADQAALVFSSFTSHLGLLRHALEERGFSIRYLDGSTPPGRRTEEIEAFQAGHGDVFLISLKAGGTGLNLTRATYVLHLDPWWNPAAEDQATDRAHRIGQTEPVTVYRFVSEGTVEEQIVALHAHKRDLARSLLGHSGSAEIPDTDTLMQLLEESRSAATTSAAPQADPPQAALPLQSATPEPPAPVEAPSPAEPPAPVAPVASDEVVERMTQAFQAHLERDMAPSSARLYARCAHHALTHARSHPDWADGVEAYVELAVRGEGATRSCTRIARPVSRRLLPWLRTTGARHAARP